MREAPWILHPPLVADAPSREAAALARMTEHARWCLSIGAVASVAGALAHASLSAGSARGASLLVTVVGLGLAWSGARWLRALASARKSLEGPARDVLLVRHVELLSRTEPWNTTLLAWDAHEWLLAKLGAWQWATPPFMVADGVPARVHGPLTRRSAVVVSCSAGVLTGRVAHVFRP
jgi:hypothetical protein